MNGRTRASRVATAGSRNVALQADTGIFASSILSSHAKAIAQRCEPSSAVALAAAVLAYPQVNSWRGRA